MDSNLIEYFLSFSDGTSLTVSFTPVEYGKEKLGKLIVETKQMFW